MFIATYKDRKVLIEDEVDSWFVEGAYREAKKKAKQNGWTLVKVCYRKPPPIPSVTLPKCEHERFTFLH